LGDVDVDEMIILKQIEEKWRVLKMQTGFT
jgi:hypothetical protein